MGGMRRAQGSGHLYVKWGPYYVRWRAVDGRNLNRRVGAVRTRGAADGLTRAEAERAARRLVEADALRRPPEPARRSRTVDEVPMSCGTGSRWKAPDCRIARTASRCSSSMLAIGKRRVETVTSKDIERLAGDAGQGPGAEDGAQT
jgi:hypothetical protein